MRKQFYKTLEGIVKSDANVIALLGDIGVFGCRNIFSQCPAQIINVGVCEQSMVSMAAGMAKEGLIPIVHTIAPFIVERATEQLKLDVNYQSLPVKLVGIGGSYDYAALGMTHHCPADVAILKTMAHIDIIVPGCAQELDTLLKATYSYPLPIYYRLSDFNHSVNVNVRHKEANVMRTGKDGTIVVVGNLLSAVMEAVKDMDVSVIYYTTIVPFDSITLKQHYNTGRIVIVEPFYVNTLASDVVETFHTQPVAIKSIGVPRYLNCYYGKKEEHDELYGLTAPKLEEQIKKFIW